MQANYVKINLMNIKRWVKISYFTMLTIIGAITKLPVPFIPSEYGFIMFTLQGFFAVMSGLILGCSDGAISQFIYMALGLVGLPIFINGGGISYLLQPTFGYIFSFFIASFASGICFRKLKTLSVLKLFGCGLVGLIIIYLFGMTYQVLILFVHLKETMTFSLTSAAWALVLFPIDALLVYLACLIYPKAMKLIGMPDKKFVPSIDFILPVKEKEKNEEPSGNKEKPKKEKEKVPLPEPAGINSKGCLCGKKQK